MYSVNFLSNLDELKNLLNYLGNCLPQLGTYSTVKGHVGPPNAALVITTSGFTPRRTRPQLTNPALIRGRGDERGTYAGVPSGPCDGGRGWEGRSVL